MRISETMKKCAVAAGVLFGLLFTALAGFMCLGLAFGSMADRACIAVFILILIGISILILRFEKFNGCMLAMMLPVVSLGFLVRVMNLDTMSWDYIYFLHPWFSYFHDNGGFSAIASIVSNYNVPYLYFLAFISYFRMPDLYLIKTLSLIFDVILAWGCLRLARRLRGEIPGDWLPLAVFAVMFLSPVVIIDGACWAQCDEVYVALAVHAVAGLLDGKNRTSLVLAALAFSFKLQTIFILPIYGVLWLAKKIRFREFFIFPITYFVVTIPAVLLGRPFADTLSVYFAQMDKYPMLTMDAPSMYQFLPYWLSMESDGGVLYSFLKWAGIVLAAILVFILLYIGFRLGSRLDKRACFAMIITMAYGIPFFLPHMHERYFFLAGVLAWCLAALDHKWIIMAAMTEISSTVLYLLWLQGTDYFRIERPAMAFLMLIVLVLSIKDMISVLPKGDKIAAGHD